MKHNVKITIILLLMFVVTQFIGIYVVNHYLSTGNNLPYGMTPPEVQSESDYTNSFLPSIIISFIIAISLLFLLTKFKSEIIMKIWFFIVVTLALGITITSFLPASAYTSLYVLIIALPLAFIKIYRRNFLVHNFTELFIYPVIAAVFVPLLNLMTVIILLILISAYDVWAVWHSGMMQKMAKYQINKLKIFAGFFVPYVSGKLRAKIKKMKPSQLKKSKIKVNLAILGGGDIIFPIISAGVMLKTLGFWPAVLVIIGAGLGLTYLFVSAEKKKFYPAMPFITAGILLAIIISLLLF
ncbi:hypothetical protein HYT23_01445 [Candidatus Pacearchaeota archaeon]|nr:hypothetical protein [Candidatus Pacearchaeota archaeon]